MKLLSSIVNVERLSCADRQAMFDLMQECYANIRWDTFMADLQAKWVVIQVHEPEHGKLVGFSTQVMLHVEINRKPVHALFSGDTVVQPAYWGDPALAHQWGRFTLQLIDQYEARDLYWFLTSKGFRTYRYLPLFFREYYPATGRLLPDHEADVVDILGRLIGGDRYDPACRVIRATAAKDYVRDGVSEPGLRPQSDPHVQFFIEQNPRYARGDELCCLAPLSHENFTRAAYRVINAHTREREAI
jgi:hypothetical protein